MILHRSVVTSNIGDRVTNSAGRICFSSDCPVVLFITRRIHLGVEGKFLASRDVEMRGFFQDGRRMVGCLLLVLSGCSGPLDPNQKLVEKYLADTDLSFHVVKRYGTATSDDLLVKHPATKSAEAKDPAIREKILKAQSWLPFTATRVIFRIDGKHTDDDALFLVRNGAVVEVYYLHPEELDGLLFAEFAERTFL